MGTVCHLSRLYIELIESTGTVYPEWPGLAPLSGLILVPTKDPKVSQSVTKCHGVSRSVILQVILQVILFDDSLLKVSSDEKPAGLVCSEPGPLTPLSPAVPGTHCSSARCDDIFARLACDDHHSTCIESSQQNFLQTYFDSLITA